MLIQGGNLGVQSKPLVYDALIKNKVNKKVFAKTSGDLLQGN